MSGPFHKGLENHLANHLERVALFALPRNTEQTDSPLTRSDIAHVTASQSSSTELQYHDQSDSRGDNLEDSGAEDTFQESDKHIVARALKMAQDNPAGEIDSTTSSILEDAFAQICSEIQLHPDSYIMTQDDFAVFSHFQNRFQGNKAANDAKDRYLAAQDMAQDKQDDGPAYAPVADPLDKSDLPSEFVVWGPWSRLPEGQWYREGQDASGKYFLQSELLRSRQDES
jgi:hypothetical protein